MMRSFLAVVVAACLSLSSLSAQASDRAASAVRWVTPYGVQAVFLAAPEIPMVDLSVDIDAGNRWDPAPKAGLAAMTLSMLSRGVRAEAGQPALTEVQISQTLADLAVQRGGNAGMDRVSISMRMLADADVRQAAVGLLARIIAHPAFDPAILEREKQRTIAGIRESLTQPQSIATRALWKSMYGTHPYGAEATAESVGAIAAADLAAFHRERWQPQRMRVTIVGALTEAQARELVDGVFAFFARTSAVPQKPSIARPAQVSPLAPVRQAIAHPASQSHIWLGMPGIARDDPDFFALTVGNYIFGGGGFVSRLTEEVREKRGLSYSVFSAFQPMAQPGPFLIGLQTQSAKAPEALKVVEDTLRRFLSEGPTEKELKAARQNLVGGFALRLDTNRKLLDNLAQINYYDLPLDYLQTWTSRVSAVTRADIVRAMNRVIDPARLSAVVVAGPAGFAP